MDQKTREHMKREMLRTQEQENLRLYGFIASTDLNNKITRFENIISSIQDSIEEAIRTNKKSSYISLLQSDYDQYSFALRVLHNIENNLTQYTKHKIITT